MSVLHLCVVIITHTLNTEQAIKSLTTRLEKLSSQVDSQKTEIKGLKKENNALRKEVKGLTTKLKRYEHPKNSNNSSIPPSQDMNRPTRKSLRKSSGLKPGGQKGRAGKTLKQVEHPDVIKECVSNYCKCCGEDLSTTTPVIFGKRQVLDIPKVEIKVTEYHQIKKVCHCGASNLGQYPSEANAPVSYGNNIEGLIAYLSTRHYIPFERLRELLVDVFGAHISTGGIYALLQKAAQKALPAYNAIKSRITEGSLAVGSDETGVKVDGSKHWAWTWQNEEATFISITDNRGFKSVEENFENGFEKAVLVHDCWASHFKTKALSHQVCLAHLLRDLNYLTEKYKHKWSKLCKTIFQSALDLKRQMKTSDYLKLPPQIIALEKCLDKLLQYTLPDDNEETITFQKRLIKYRHYIFTFLHREEVPADNNGSERAVRNIKVKQKVSGQFKSDQGADAFAILRSVIDTTVKNDGNVMEVLTNLTQCY